MFFGLANSPSTFSALMNDIFKDLIVLGKVTIYLDNILIFTNNMEEHRTLVHEVLKHLKEHDLFCKPEKCEFAKQKLSYLGFVISPDEVHMDPIKLKGISDWPVPKTVRDVRKFIGFCNFYRKFIRHYAHLAAPLNGLLKKANAFKWTPDCQKVFDKLKTRFIKSPVLVTPDPSKPFEIQANASNYATGAILLQ